MCVCACREGTTFMKPVPWGCVPSVQHYLACAVWLIWLLVPCPPMLTIAPGLVGPCAHHCRAWPWGCPPLPPDFQTPQEAVVRVTLKGTPKPTAPSLSAKRCGVWQADTAALHCLLRPGRALPPQFS